MSQPPRRVSCGLVLSVVEPVRLTLQLAVAGVPSACLEETLEVSSSGSAVDLVEVVVPGVGRVHVCTPPPGRVEIGYSATVSGQLDAPVVGEAERIVYRRPSRYAESDRLAPMAQAEFAGIADHAELLGAVSSWVGSRLSYVAGSSGPTEGAVDTMLKRQGVCRDYAHLVVALLRALDVPARLAAVYAPGLDPMDFGTGRRRVRGGGSPVGRGSIRSIMCGWACQFMNPRSHARKASMSMAWLSAQLDRPASSASTFRRIVGSPAASWSTGQSPSVSTIASRGNDEVMIRGTFANIRLRNQLAPGTEGGYPVTSRQPTGQ